MEMMNENLRNLAEYLVEEGKEHASALADKDMERQKLAQTTREINGVMYRWDLNARRWEPMDSVIPADEPHPQAIEFFTLQGLVDYINENTEGLIPTNDERLILMVCDVENVCLFSKPSQFEKERHIIARAKSHAPAIPFEQYMDAEYFSTMLLSRFIETDARNTLFSVVKSMTKKQSCNTTDDGVSQVITVEQGVSMASNVTFKNPVPLKPMRTFSEVDQPESNFTLRVNEDAEAALFESDGGAWKVQAVENIKNYLREKITNPNVVVIA